MGLDLNLRKFYTDFYLTVTFPFSAVAASLSKISQLPVRVMTLTVPAKQSRYLEGRTTSILISPVRAVQFSNVPHISVTLEGIAGAVVKEIQPENV